MCLYIADLSLKSTQDRAKFDLGTLYQIATENATSWFGSTITVDLLRIAGYPLAEFIGLAARNTKDFHIINRPPVVVGSVGAGYNAESAVR
jgi:hypothetical protein